MQFYIAIQIKIKRGQRSESMAALRITQISNKPFANMNKCCRNINLTNTIQTPEKYLTNIAIQTQKTMKRGQRSESNLSIAALLIVSPQSEWSHPQKKSAPILRNKAYYLCCKRAPQRDTTFVNLMGTEGVRAWLICQYPGWPPLSKIMQMSCRLSIFCTNTS